MNNRGEKNSQPSNVISLDLSILGSIAKKLIEDCYQGRSSKEAINNFLLGTSRLRDKVKQ